MAAEFAINSLLELFDHVDFPVVSGGDLMDLIDTKVRGYSQLWWGLDHEVSAGLLGAQVVSEAAHINTFGHDHARPFLVAQFDESLSEEFYLDEVAGHGEGEAAPVSPDRGV